MSGVRARGEDIRRYIIDNVEKYPRQISRVAADHFGITRQAVNKHLQRLTAEKILAETGKTRNRVYTLAPLAEWRKHYSIGGERSPRMGEDVIWTNDIKSALGRLPDNVMNIWHHGFTEMFNNALEHSGADTVSVTVRKNAADIEMHLADDGIGIFKKIQSALGLLDERHAVLELAKGKFTTDPKNHSGEGIFFSSRMYDDFWILSGGVIFSHTWGKKEDWIQEPSSGDTDGTHVFMKLHNHTSRTTTKIFDQFTSDEDYTFSKTVVPVKLAKYGDDNLISRSQAKRLLARVELFKVVLLDFKEVPSIGQAFADEIFRVFANEHPEIELMPVNENAAVRRMIERVKLNVPLPKLPSS
jgi:anti-sigma regulatory factor (Ser/Thr protein kinase)